MILNVLWGKECLNIKVHLKKGRLIIQFEVVFPTFIAPEFIPKLETCLPPRPRVDISMDAEECTMIDYNPSQDNRQRRSHHQAYEEDDGYHHGPRVQQCTSS